LFLEIVESFKNYISQYVMQQLKPFVLVKGFIPNITEFWSK